MVKLVVLYGHPTNPEEFDRYFTSVHLPLADQIPGVVGISYGHLTSVDDSSAPPYYLAAEVTFESLDDLHSGMSSPQGSATVADVGEFATGGATNFIQTQEQ
jgi:uncharacterized protein (TIGR02118 family)